jgi:hypothetical protein
MLLATGRGLRQPGLMALARRALTRMKGLTPLILMAAVKTEVVMEIAARARRYVSRRNAFSSVWPITEFIRYINPKEQGRNCLCELREPHRMAAVGWVFSEV